MTTTKVPTLVLYNAFELRVGVKLPRQRFAVLACFVGQAGGPDQLPQALAKEVVIGRAQRAPRWLGGSQAAGWHGQRVLHRLPKVVFVKFYKIRKN